jgi:hypothetical protein
MIIPYNPRPRRPRRLSPDFYRNAVAALALLLLCLVVYCRVTSFGFVNYDDNIYVYQNGAVLNGLNWRGFRWAWKTHFYGNYHPLVWLTYMADVSVFGEGPAAFHGVNLFCHIASTLLLFAALRRLTGAFWPSFWVAALWGIHPLNVEPVAWVSERKGILATFFGMLALWAYAVYAARPSWRRYLPVVLAYAAGLLSKPSVVTLPVLLLLADWWPLGRMGKVAFGRLLAEKLPLLLLAIGASGLAARAQAQISALPVWPLAMRLDNVAASYWWYVAKALYPVHLAVFYPYRPLDARLVVAEWAGLLVLSLTAFRLARRAPFLLFGWLWYVVSLLPVCGLVQVGQHVHADRYAYIPLVGLLVSLVWGLAALVRHRMALLMHAALVCLAVLSWFQLGTWKSTMALWQHDVRVTGGSSVAYLNLGDCLSALGRREEAIGHYQSAIACDPDHASVPHVNLGDCLLALGRREEAIGHYQSAIACDPDYAPGQYWLGVALLQDGRPDEAIPHLAKAIRLRPWEPAGPVTLAQAQKAIVVAVP